MQNKPYFCPNCRSNRVKFSLITSTTLEFRKDALTGEITAQSDPSLIEQPEPSIQCLVCHLTTNEMRFIKQAEREPRVITETQPTYI